MTCFWLVILPLLQESEQQRPREFFSRSLPTLIEYNNWPVFVSCPVSSSDLIRGSQASVLSLPMIPIRPQFARTLQNPPVFLRLFLWSFRDYTHPLQPPLIRLLIQLYTNANAIGLSFLFPQERALLAACVYAETKSQERTAL